VNETRHANHVHGPIAKEQLPFWGDVAPSEHVAHFYESESSLLQLLTRYVGSGLLAGESAIVIATRTHLRELDERLNASGVYVATSRLAEQYITFDADEALEKFIVNQRPDDKKFYGLVLSLIERAGADGDGCAPLARW
jgi:hypothetical protein